MLSTDQENDPDIIGTIAASAALTISEIPFLGPVAAVRIGRIDGEFVINPTISQLEESEIDLVVSGTRDAIMMVEAGAKIVPEVVMAEAIMFGHRSLAPIIDLQEQLREQVGKPKRLPFIEPGIDSVVEFVEALQRDQHLRRLRRRDHQPRRQAGLDRRDRRRQGRRAARSPTVVHLVNPGGAIVGKQLHGITDEDVKAAPAPAEAAQKFLDWAGDALLVGHNVGFDIGFLDAAVGDRSKTEAGPYLDTLVLARRPTRTAT